MLKISFVNTAICPKIFSISICNTVDIFPNISIPILKNLLSVSILHAIAKLSFVEIMAEIFALSVRQSTQPVTCVHLPWRKPIKASLSWFCPFFEISYISVSIGLELVAHSTRMIIMIHSFENFAIIVDRDTPSIHPSFSLCSTILIMTMARG